jgi:hypothetical protein
MMEHSDRRICGRRRKGKGAMAMKAQILRQWPDSYDIPRGEKGNSVDAPTLDCARELIW